MTVRSGKKDRRTEDATHGGKAVAGKGWKVVGDFSVIRLPGVAKEINLATKHKTRDFVRFLYGHLTGIGTAEFYVEEMREAFNAQFPKDLAHRRWMSDRFRADLFRGKEREFDLLFETLDKAAGRYRMRGM